jgi:hypothetical protein
LTNINVPGGNDSSVIDDNLSGLGLVYPVFGNDFPVDDDAERRLLATRSRLAKVNVTSSHDVRPITNLLFGELGLGDGWHCGQESGNSGDKIPTM